MKEIFPEEEYKLRPLPEDHPVWRAKHLLIPEHPSRSGASSTAAAPSSSTRRRTSPATGTSREHSPTNPAVIKAIKIGQNVIDYATGREMPADKLTIREVHNFKAETPKRGALRIAKLMHAGDWNIAPQAIPNLMDALRKPPFSFDVVITQKDLFAARPQPGLLPADLHPRPRRALVPQGGPRRAAQAPRARRRHALRRRRLRQPGVRRRVPPVRRRAASRPSPWSRSPATTSSTPPRSASTSRDVQYTKAAGGGRDFPQLEGVKINGHWAIIYSKFDIGCALERHTGIDCKGYTYESALKIAGNIVIYSTLP